MSQEIMEVESKTSMKFQEVMLNTKMFEQVERFAAMMASSKATVPNHLKGNTADCMAITMQALRWGMDPFAVASKTHLVNGNLGYESQLVNAVVSSSTAIEGRFHYEFSEPEWQDDKDPAAWCRVGAKLRGEDQLTWGEKVYPAKQQVKNSPLWKTDPKQQTAYLALKKWARMYTPAVILGVYTNDEAEEFSENRGMRDIGSSSDFDQELKAKAITKEKPVQAEVVKEKEPAKQETKPTQSPEAKADEAALANVLSKMRNAQSMDDLNDCAGDAAQLSPGSQKTARSVYAEARKVLLDQQVQPEPEPVQQLTPEEQAQEPEDFFYRSQG